MLRLENLREALEEKFGPDISRRVMAIAIVIGAELLFVILLLTFGGSDPKTVAPVISVSTFDVASQEAAAEEEEPAPQEKQAETAPDMPAPEAAPEEDQPDKPTPQVQPAPITPQPDLPPAAVIPLARGDTAKANITPKARPAPAPTKPSSSYGPSFSGSSRGADSKRVGTAPNGQPMYAARWFREPRDDELSGYLSTASGPGWGLIVCKTASNYRVENCEIIAESPHGSGIARSAKAAAWQFQVRPPRLGGQSQIGAWVRIRIDYTANRR